ncbi:MAG TPA: hypothetical protein VG498_11320 [Terriglobales bacterium]|nr:hypothetical protein [Terriglobales bacterium]
MSLCGTPEELEADDPVWPLLLELGVLEDELEGEVDCEEEEGEVAL